MLSVTSVQSSAASSSSNGTKLPKKARVGERAQPATGSGSKQKTRKRLPSLHEMPFDIFLEILLQVDPKGLVHLSRASKDTRRALVNKDMDKLVWKPAREGCKALEPPTGWSEARWVSFLFSSFCYSCGKANATVDFYILKRLCIRCKKAGLSSWLYFLERLRSIGKGTELADRDCVLFTKFRESARKGAGYAKLSWKDDVDKTIAEWVTLVERTNGGTDKDAVLELAKFCTDKADFVHNVHKDALPMQKWEEDIQRKRKQDLNSIKERLVAGLRQRFMELGLHKHVDIKDAINMSTTGICGSAATEVTDRTWKTWRAKLEPAVYDARNNRLKTIRTQRMDRIIKSWILWVDSLDMPTIERLHYPSTRDIWYLPAVTAIREADPETELQQSAVQDIIDAFPNITADFVHRRRQDLCAMLPSTPSVHKHLDALELATSVFTTPKTELDFDLYSHDQFSICDSVVMGWKALSICQCAIDVDDSPPDMPASPQRTALPVFDPVLSEVARTLVILCGLNPTSTSIHDMDVVLEQFLCCACAQDVFHLVDSGARKWVVAKDETAESRTVEVYTWREALEHARRCRSDVLTGGRIDSPSDHDVPPSFRLLSDLKLEVQDYNIEEHRMRFQSLPNWYCNHCILLYPIDRDDLVDHIYSRHRVVNAMAERDLFKDPLKPFSLDEPTYLSLRSVPA